MSSSVPVVAWRHSDTHCLYETESEVQLADADSSAEGLVLQKDHLAEVERLRSEPSETEQALFGAIQKIMLTPPCTDGMGNFIIEHFDEGGRSLGIEHIDPMSVVQEMVSIASAALTAYQDKHGRKG